MAADVDVRRDGRRKRYLLRLSASGPIDARLLDVSDEEAATPQEVAAARPRTRADCLAGGKNAARPCPWVSCRYHLLLEVDRRTGNIKLTRGTDPWEDDGLPSCALDVADGLPRTSASTDGDRAQDDAGEVVVEETHSSFNASLEEIGLYLGITRERVRQIEEHATRVLRHNLRSAGVRSVLNWFGE